MVVDSFMLLFLFTVVDVCADGNAELKTSTTIREYKYLSYLHLFLNSPKPTVRRC